MDNKKNISTSISNRVMQIPKSAIHEMTRLSKEVEDPAFLSWAKPTSGTPDHINKAAVKAIEEGKTGGYSEPAGMYALREKIAEKLKRINNKPTRAALINKLRKDMKNKKKMRGFTLERQKAILKKFNALSRY